MITISVFLTIIVANLGGYLDTVVKANIDETITNMMVRGGWLKEITDEAERNQIVEQTRAAMQEERGPEFSIPGALLPMAVERPDARLGHKRILHTIRERHAYCTENYPGFSTAHTARFWHS